MTFSSFQGECVAKIFPYNIDAGSFDACDDQLDYAIRRKGIGTFGPFVKFSDLDLDDVTPGGTAFGDVQVELKVTDDCGNYNIAWTTVRLEDKNTNVTKICGSTLIILDCTANIDTAIIDNLPRVILNGCEIRDLTVTYDVRSHDIHELCNTGRVEVDYFVEGSRDTICSKTFILGGLDSLDIIWPESEITVTCDETDFGDVIISGGICNKALASEKLREFTVPSGLGFCKKIIREITVIDWCTYEPNEGDTIGIYRFVQSIKVVDHESPTIQCEDLEVTAGPNCGVSGITVSASGSDNGLCIEALNWEAAVDLNDDGFYELDLTVLPSGENMVTARIDSFVGQGVHNVRWRAMDNCGNSEEVICTITVTDDKAPSPQCISTVSTATMSNNGSVTIWAADFDPMSNSSDECGGLLTYSFSGDDPNVPSMLFTCDDIDDNVSALLDLKIYVWDESGNRDYCNVHLRIDDNSDACPDSNSTASVLISGVILTSLGDNLESAEVKSTSMQTNISDSNMTDVAGQYSFQNNLMMSDYEITANKSDDYLNGVSTLDILLIQRHILNFKSFENPYDIIAADVNGDERVSALDLVVLRSLLLGRVDALPQGLSWKFINADQHFDDPRIPWPLEESLYLSELRTTMTNQDFIAVKLGDVNGNAIANSQLIAGGRNDKNLSLTLVDRQIKEGELVQLDLNLNVVEDIFGLQLNLVLNKGTWINAKGTSLIIQDGQMFVDANKLRISWTTLEASSDPGELTLTFEAEDDGMLSDFVMLSKTGLVSQLYFGTTLETADLDLDFRDIDDGEFALYQNVPNPFSGETLVGFNISREGMVEFSIFDITGRQLFGQSSFYDAGRHEILIDHSIIDKKGVLYYQISYDNKVATRKMISIE